jgi:hypothetical protein
VRAAAPAARRRANEIEVSITLPLPKQNPAKRRGFVLAEGDELETNIL